MLLLAAFARGTKNFRILSENSPDAVVGINDMIHILQF
jgi:hypothetical protein